MGKGHNIRPSKVSREVFEKNYDKIFGKKIESGDNTKKRKSDKPQKSN